MRSFKNPQAIERRLSAIAADRRSGASELALRALRVFALARPAADAPRSRYQRDIHRLSRRMARLRPAMSPIRTVVERVVFEYDSAPEPATVRDAHKNLNAVVAKITVSTENANTRTARHFEKQFGRFKAPICISYSSSVVGALNTLERPRVFVCESRPLMEGRRMARLLRSCAVAVTVVTESQIGLVMPECDCVVMGCDAIHPDGSIVNKTGSYLLALAAREHRRPVIVVGDTNKVCDGPDEFERQPESQVWPRAPRGIGVRNLVFERVPAHLVDYIALDTGVFKTGRMRQTWKRLRTRRARL